MSETNKFLQDKVIHWSRDITSLANPIVIVFVSLVALGLNTSFYHLLILLAVNEVLCSLIKLLYHRPRPDGQSFEGAVVKIDAGSFPSIHSSRIMVTYLSLIYHFDSMVLKIILTLMILAVGTSRVMLKRHYWSDVIAGFIIGVAIYFLGTYLLN